VAARSDAGHSEHDKTSSEQDSFLHPRTGISESISPTTLRRPLDFDDHTIDSPGEWDGREKAGSSNEEDPAGEAAVRADLWRTGETISAPHTPIPPHFLDTGARRQSQPHTPPPQPPPTNSVVLSHGRNGGRRGIAFPRTDLMLDTSVGWNQGSGKGAGKATQGDATVEAGK